MDKYTYTLKHAENDLKIKLERHLGRPLEGTYGEKTQNELKKDIMNMIKYLIPEK